MGFNTSFVLYNDHLDMISKDSEFGKRLAEAIHNLHRAEYVSVYTMSANRNSIATAGAVITSHHADEYSVVVVGGNSGIELGRVSFPMWDNPVGIIKDLAEQHGYRLVKKSMRKKE
jgi:hypothetical protein